MVECRFKDEEERMPVYTIINTTFPVLLEILNHLLALPNPAIEVADLIKLILKIFWSSAYVSDRREQEDLLGLISVIVMCRYEKLEGIL